MGSYPLQYWARTGSKPVTWGMNEHAYNNLPSIGRTLYRLCDGGAEHHRWPILQGVLQREGGKRREWSGVEI